MSAISSINRSFFSSFSVSHLICTYTNAYRIEDGKPNRSKWHSPSYDPEYANRAEGSFRQLRNR